MLNENEDARHNFGNPIKEFILDNFNDEIFSVGICWNIIEGTTALNVKCEQLNSIINNFFSQKFLIIN